jgi:hypothetical protein
VDPRPECERSVGRSRCRGCWNRSGCLLAVGFASDSLALLRGWLYAFAICVVGAWDCTLPYPTGIWTSDVHGDGVVVFQSELQLISDRVRVGKPCGCLPLLTGHSRIMLGWWFATRHHRAITGVMMFMDQAPRL